LPEEAYDEPGPFAPGSGALFVVETYQWVGGNRTPVQFNDPVDLVIEFQPESVGVLWTDTVTFDNQSAGFDRMRAVRDIRDGPEVDFQFIDYPQDLDTTSRTITLTGYRNLTGPSGQATYGAVARLHDPTSGRRWELYR
jgi:hypothetical protein